MKRILLAGAATLLLPIAAAFAASTGMNAPQPPGMTSAGVDTTRTADPTNPASATQPDYETPVTHAYVTQQLGLGTWLFPPAQDTGAN